MITRFIAICCLAVLTGCTNDDLLVSQFDQLKINANPFFSGSCHDMESWMVSENSVLVYNGDYGIYTEDDFETFSYVKYKDVKPCESGYLKTLFFDGDNYRVVDDYVLYYKNHDSDLQSFDIRNLQHSPSLGLFDSFTTPVFRDNQTFLFVRKLRDHNKVFLNLYQADMSSLSSVAMSTIYSVDSVKDVYGHFGLFITDGRQLIYADQEFAPASDSIYINAHITTDGLNWTSSRVMGLPFRTFLNVPVRGYQTEVEGKGSTLIFGSSSLGFYISRDAGNKWSKIKFEFPETVTSVRVIDDQTIYALVKKDIEAGAGTISQMIVSTDAGNTWEIRPTLLYGDRISFFDKNNGVATSKQILQITNNGGNTWKPVFMGHN